MFKYIILSRITTIIMGLTLIFYAFYEIYEELFDPTHEHILIIIGMLLVFSSIGHVNEGIYKIAQNVKPEKNLRTLERISVFFCYPVVRIVLGVTILIAAGFGLYEDFEKIHSKSVSMGIGVLMIVISVYKLYSGGEKLMKGVSSEPQKDEPHELPSL